MNLSSKRLFWAADICFRCSNSDLFGNWNPLSPSFPPPRSLPPPPGKPQSCLVALVYCSNLFSIFGKELNPILSSFLEIWVGWFKKLVHLRISRGLALAFCQISLVSSFDLRWHRRRHLVRLTSFVGFTTATNIERTTCKGRESMAFFPGCEPEQAVGYWNVEERNKESFFHTELNRRGNSLLQWSRPGLCRCDKPHRAKTKYQHSTAGLLRTRIIVCFRLPPNGVYLRSSEVLIV